MVSTIVELQRIRGLVPATDDEEPAPNDPQHRLVEAVVSPSSPLVGQSIRDANFRTVYDAAVIAVHRNGARVPGKIGEIVLEAGDTLLMQGAPGFLRAHRNSPDFYLVSEIPEQRDGRATTGPGSRSPILLAMVLCASVGPYPISVAAFLAAGLLLVTRCIDGRGARRSVDWSILDRHRRGLRNRRRDAEDRRGGRRGRPASPAAAGSLGPHATLVLVYVASLRPRRAAAPQRRRGDHVSHRRGHGGAGGSRLRAPS